MSRKPIFLLALLATANAQTVTHRWTFNTPGAASHNTPIPDVINAAPATIVGTGAVRNGTVVTLPGTSAGNVASASISAYLDLPNGIVSSKTHMTVEIWATIVSSQNWQRLFDFGRMNTSGIGEVGTFAGSPGTGTNSRDDLMLAVQRGTALNDQRLAARIDGLPEVGANNTTTTTLGTQYHYVATFQAGAGVNPTTGGRFSWYRDGSPIGFVDTNFRLNQLEDVNNWLGRSQFSDDRNSNITYNEVRIYDYVLSGTQITENATNPLGPNAALPAPTVAADSVTMLHAKKARLRVLANDSGEIVPSTLSIDTPPASGTATVSADGSILYTHTTGTPANDSFVYRIANSTGQSSTGTVTVTFSNALKIANPALNVPANPPANAYALPNAFGTLTFSQPLCLATPPGETQRLFVCEKGGLIRVITDVTAASPTAPTFLNLPAALPAGETLDTGSESGLLGLAFHPDYATNRYFYVFYSVTKSVGGRRQRVSRFTTQAGNPNLADTTSEKILIDQRDEYGNHNGGDMHFGPNDGYLYISVGDEGNGEDSPTFNSQFINKDLFSGILRIDVDLEPEDYTVNDGTGSDDDNLRPNNHTAVILHSGNPLFEIPVDNPFVSTANGGTWNGLYLGNAVGGTVRTEFWATGLRNPWRMAFDPGTGALWCADVGQYTWEEVDVITRGGNYGWVFREGEHNGYPTASHPPVPANFDTLYHDEPIYEYPRGGDLGGYSVTGGRVYRGTRLGELTGKYIFADYGSGNFWAMSLDGNTIQRLTGEGGIAGFGYDPSNQDILAADLGDGVIRRLTTAAPTGTFPATLSATGLFADLTDLSPSPGVVPYTVNLPFWSDHAIKSRWMVVPDGTSQFTWSKDGLWTLPTDTVWVKHFDMEMQRGVPASKKRIETRLIVKNAGGAYGVSYRWNEAGTEATLVEDGGVNFNLAVTDNGNPVPQTWRIPSRAECMICHTPQAGHALSFNTRQLNLANDMLGFSGNQLTTLQLQGYLANNPGSPNLLPRHVGPLETGVSTEAKVRSYIDVNCSYCHKSGGTAPASWDGRAQLTLTQTGLVNGSAANSGSDPLNKLVVPGDTAHSIVFHRVGATGGFTRMPPLATNVIDTANVTLLTNWINGELDDRVTYDAWRISNFEPDNDPAGASTMDPDGDGVTNQDEFLANTNPHSGSSALRPQVSGNPLKLSFTLPVNRSFRIDSSTNLGSWTPWDVPGNQGLPVAGGLIEFTLPIADPQRFFRVEVMEN